MLENVKKIYMIGIGGVSMSALAKLLKCRNFEVKGSDSMLSVVTDKLSEEGIEVLQGNAPEFVDWCDACVITSAISKDNVDLKMAESQGKKIYSRAEVLAFLSENKKCISIAGTHGKTSTTGMLASVMLTAGLDPTIHVGGVLNDIKSNFHIGNGEYFLTEACEYKDAFLSLESEVSVILNIENDHMDYFKNIDNLYNSFEKFAKNTKKHGFCVINNKILDKISIENLNILSFGDGGYIQSRNVKQYDSGKYSYDLYIDNEYVDCIKLSAFGKHNVENSLAVIAVALLIDVDMSDIVLGLKNYQGVARRMEFISDKPFVVHDYAHHPTEIKSTLNACKDICENVVVIFQPHLFSRTKDLYQEFLSCFGGVKEVWLLPIYPAREKPIEGITSLNLSKDLLARGVDCKHFSCFCECEKALIEYKEDVLFAVLGAGDIQNLAYRFKKE